MEYNSIFNLFTLDSQQFINKITILPLFNKTFYMWKKSSFYILCLDISLISSFCLLVGLTSKFCFNKFKCSFDYNRVQKILEKLHKLRKSCNQKRNINGMYSEKLHFDCLQQLPTLRLKT